MHISPTTAARSGTPRASAADRYDSARVLGRSIPAARRAARSGPLRPQERARALQVVRGLDEGVQCMSVGERVQLIFPAEWGYGARGFPGLVPPNTPLEFDLELVEIM